MTVVTARGLTKRFGDFIAVDALDLEIEAGECFGMLGPNGAGKTTTLRMIGCVARPDEGSLDVLGMDVRQHQRRIKARLGVVPQHDSLDDELTVVENLVVYAGYFGMRRKKANARAEELLEWMSLGDRADAKVRTLSGGMKRRLVIARALVNDPEIVLLDEPTTGLDPQARHHIWQRLRGLRAEGATLVLTTHYMEEAANLCDRLVIMDRAKVVVAGTPKELVAESLPTQVVEVPKASLNGTPLDGLPGDPLELSDRWHVHTDDAEKVTCALADLGVDTHTVLVRMASLEDVFLELTGRSLVE